MQNVTPSRDYRKPTQSDIILLDDGYRLTYGGLDYLALHTHLKHKTLYSTGNCVGVGKESDIYVVADSSGKQLILKIHRLGRISFRSIKNNRDYLKHRSSASWMYMSRLAALKEYSFMQVLKKNGFNVPEPVAQSRHTVVMELIDAFPLRQIQSVPDPAGLYAELIDVILRLASFGLIHGDFNEFNILIKESEVPPDPGTTNGEEDNDKESQMQDTISGEARAIPTITPVIIDFPQMVSIDHVNAEMYFDRDVGCVKRFFERRFNFVSDVVGPHFADVRKLTAANKGNRLDVEVEASGFSKKMAKELEKYMEAIGVGEQAGEADEGDSVHDSDELTNETDDEPIKDTCDFQKSHSMSELPTSDIAGLSLRSNR